MDIRLGDNQYGKAETRLVRVDRHTDGHEVTDLNVSTALSGDLAATHLTGDNAGVLPPTRRRTPCTRSPATASARSRTSRCGWPRHFVESTPTIHRARVQIEQYSWERVAHHSFVRDSGTRTTTVTYDGTAATVVSGVDDLVVMNTTGSEFHGFHKDGYTTLPETNDRILATAVTAPLAARACRERRLARVPQRASGHLLEAFADTHSLSLQQTLYAMGERVLRHRDELAEVRLSLPNKHHFLVDLSPFELDNPGEVFYRRRPALRAHRGQRRAGRRTRARSGVVVTRGLP